MPTDSGERRTTTKTLQVGVGGGAPPPEPEHLPCPRCDSTNTKFCYYNNYNFSQPRHFCKSCRRYWTHGGTLRDIPIGGGSRKNAKRSRTTNTTSTAAFPAATPILIPQGGSFTSLLNSTPAGIFGFGMGGFEDVSFGLGRAIWPFSSVGDDGAAGNSGGGVSLMGGNTWQLESGGDGGFVVGGDHCFSLPDLAISTTGNGMK